MHNITIHLYWIKLSKHHCIEYPEDCHYKEVKQIMSAQHKIIPSVLYTFIS